MKNCEFVKLIEFAQHGDERGHLVVAECGEDIPFEVKRIFYIYGSSADVIRGQHANQKTKFLLLNVAGTSKVRVKICGGGWDVYDLNRPYMGLYLPAMVWKEMYDFSPNSVLLVLASEHYDPDEYIRSYDEFIKINKGNGYGENSIVKTINRK